jgi:hypothetical protein
MFDPTKLKIPEKSMPKIDAIFAILLLIGTLSTAICVYQATRWNGIQANDYGESAMFRTESTKITTIANSQVIIDTELFLSWVAAVRKDDQAEAQFIRERFRNEFKPSFEAWIAKANTTNPIPPGTPFDLPEYSIEKYKESALLEENATASFNQGTDANENSDMYISITVLFAIVLFFCGVYSKWESMKIQLGLLLVALLIFSIASFKMISLLLSVGYV